MTLRAARPTTAARDWAATAPAEPPTCSNSLATWEMGFATLAEAGGGRVHRGLGGAEQRHAAGCHAPHLLRVRRPLHRRGRGRAEHRRDLGELALLLHRGADAAEGLGHRHALRSFGRALGAASVPHALATGRVLPRALLRTGAAALVLRVAAGLAASARVAAASVALASIGPVAALAAAAAPRLIAPPRLPRHGQQPNTRAQAFADARWLSATLIYHATGAACVAQRARGGRKTCKWHGWHPQNMKPRVGCFLIPRQPQPRAWRGGGGWKKGAMFMRAVAPRALRRLDTARLLAGLRGGCPKLAAGCAHEVRVPVIRGMALPLGERALPRIARPRHEQDVMVQRSP